MSSIIPKNEEKLTARYASRAALMLPSEIRSLFAVASRPEIVSLAGGMPNLSALPMDVMASVVQKLVLENGAEALQYGSGQGHPKLREQICDQWVSDFAGIKGFKSSKMALNEAGQPLPRIKIEIDQKIFGTSARELALKLWESDPRIAVDHRGDDQEIFLTPELLSSAEIAVVTARVIELANS